jgi:sulfhydrogenase subunit delta
MNSSLPLHKPKVAVHKFSSCDGCQLAFLNLDEDLLRLAELVDIVHFAEAGAVAPEASVDIAFIEGSVTTRDEIERIQAIRASSKFLITLGACATSGGLQALRNGVANAADWVGAIYASPEYINSLPTSTPIAQHVKVDLELWGCPVTSRQVLAVVRDLLFGVQPLNPADSVCLECKRHGNICVLVSKGKPCMGPVTRTGCGALCPSFGRDCYACFGPAQMINPEALANRFDGLGLLPERISRRFLFINNAAEPFALTGRAWQDRSHE